MIFGSAKATARAAIPRIDARTFDLMCLTMATVLVLHTTHLSLWLSGGLLIVLAGRWWQWRYRPQHLPSWIKLSLIALLVLAIVTQYGTPFGREPGTALAVGLLVLKLLESETPRDVRVGTSFACFALMAALLFDQGMVATGVVALGLLPVLATFRSLEPAQKPSTFARQLIPGAQLLLASLPLALLAFLLVPRLSSPLWGAPTSRAGHTGLSDEMSPGDFSELFTDDTPAMRVSFDGPPPPQFQRYFRAYVMWEYDGRNWQSNLPPGEPAALEVTQSTHYDVSLEPNHQRVLPTLDIPIDAPALSHMRVDRVVYAEQPVNDMTEYSVRSALRYRFQTVLDPLLRQRALELPSGFDPQTHALAAQWRAQYGNNDTAIVRAALQMFRTGGFSYTLAPAPLGRDAVDDFLFTTREGFCEHYSSSFTILMRAAGIPARVVTGYQGGYWNNLGQYLLVRQSDAHAWSEVWLSGQGWVRIDPTAMVKPQRVSAGASAAAGDELPWYDNGWLASTRNRWDVVNRWWNKGVVGFDALRQRGLLTPFGVREVDTATLEILLAIGVTLLSAVGLTWALWRRREGDPAVNALRTLERKLSRAGLVRGHAEGPQNYFRRAIRAFPAQRAELDAMMRHYLDLRYAQMALSPQTLRTFKQAVRNFRPHRMVK